MIDLVMWKSLMTIMRVSHREVNEIVEQFKYRMRGEKQVIDSAHLESFAIKEKRKTGSSY